MNPLYDRDVADEDAIMSVEERGVEVGGSAVPCPSESRDESEIDRRRCVLLPDWHSLARGMMRMRSPSIYRSEDNAHDVMQSP